MEISISASLCASIRFPPPSSKCPNNPPNYTIALPLHRPRRRRKTNASLATALNCTARGDGKKRNRSRGKEGGLFLIHSGRSSSLLVECCSCQAVGGENAFGERSGCVEVLGIGSRVDSVLDFCLGSPSLSSSSQLRCIRFWNVVSNDSQQGILQQRLLERDQNPNVVPAPLDPQAAPKSILLVASAGYGDDHAIAIDVLRAVKAAGGLVVAVILKSFDFEGRRRQDEVRTLLHTLQEYTNFYIEIDINALLKMDLVTLDEALKTTNQAVLLAIRAVSVFISETPMKHIVSPLDEMKELIAPGILQVLESYKQGNIGFGVGRNVETSILQAVYHCPFLCRPLKDLNGLVICILSSANNDDRHNVPAILRTFRQMTECKQEMIMSVIHDPSLQPNVIATTVIIMSATEQKSSKKSSILSKLAERIPIIFEFLRNQDVDTDKSQSRESLKPPNAANILDNNEIPKTNPENEAEDIGIHYNKNENSSEVFVASRENNYSDIEFLDSDADSLKYYQHNGNAYQRELLLSWDNGPDDKFSQDISEEEAANVTGASLVTDKPSIFRVPVGVRNLSDTDCLETSDVRLDPPLKMTDDISAQPLATTCGSSWNTMADASVEAVTGFYNNASAVLKGKSINRYKKQGVLSSRAASMLDSERDSQRKWRQIMELRYRGGVYKGHCQGGLPEGRGRLQYPDGSTYDGMWRYGKRSGLGTFYFSNGDVFQGTWRDDLMHGKGWLYFHNGDRWFANFWKGRANGEGRFYSKLGEVFFGRFQDGYRHGHFQCVKVDGSRSIEIWKEGVLLSSEPLDSDNNAL